jgi:hypothetical protein
MGSSSPLSLGKSQLAAPDQPLHLRPPPVALRFGFQRRARPVPLNRRQSNRCRNRQSKDDEDQQEGDHRRGEVSMTEPV